MGQNAGMNLVRASILLTVCLAVVAAAGCGSDDDGAATSDSSSTVPAPDDGDGSGAGSSPLAEAIAGFEGIEVYEGLGQDHVDDPVYDVRPPPGGDHLDRWESCGFFAVEIDDGNAVHSLEHGAVWVAYRPDLDDTQVDELESLANVETHLLVSPYPDLDTPLMLVAWGVRLPLDSVDDERFDRFLATFIRGPQTPEVGVPCRI